MAETISNGIYKEFRTFKGVRTYNIDVGSVMSAKSDSVATLVGRICQCSTLDHDGQTLRLDQWQAHGQSHQPRICWRTQTFKGDEHD